MSQRARRESPLEDMFQFGQRVDLCARLRECLANYPEDGLLKEMVQNADDAGASTFKVMLDRRKHPDRKLLLEGRLASFQGPAICTYNDERFTEKDLASIQSVGNSLKNDADGRTKTGKFGLGFNSCYHVTDCPGLLTGKRLLFLDPSQKHLANGDTGIGFNLHERHVDSAPDQFAPWRIFGCDPAKEFNGTIFRLPLRTRAHVRGSAGEGISPRPYSLSDADELLRKFVESLPDLVLFLQCVHTVEVYEWRVGEAAPRLLAKQKTCACGTADSMPRAHLRELLDRRATQDLTRLGVHHFLDHLSVRLSQAGSAEGEAYTWLVAQAFGGGSALEMSVDQDVLSRGLRPLPWGGVAARLQQPTRQLEGAGPSFKRSRIELAVRGRPFCTLPLPPHTGLPVHINGFFELSTSRRDVWTDTSGVGLALLKANWNAALLASVVAPCYVALIEAAQELTNTSEEYYAIWPQARPAEPWAQLVDEL